MLTDHSARFPKASLFLFRRRQFLVSVPPGGFTFALEDRAGNDVQFLATNLQTFLAAARKRPEIAGISTTFLPSVPQQFIDVDRDKVIKQGVRCQRRLQDDADLHGRPLHQLLQPLWPAMAGVYRSGRRLPDSRRKCRSVLRAKQQG